MPVAQDTIVLIHEALGSASYWKDFPALLAERTCTNVLAYSRAGHGDSDGPIEPRSMEYYRRQVDTILPALLREHRIANPILYGHSEGAAIALLYAAATKPVKAIIAESPIVNPGARSLATIEQMDRGQARTELIEKLGRYHRDAELVFASWVESVRGDLFSRKLHAADYLPRVACPVLVLEGTSDPFGGPEQEVALEAGIRRLRRVIMEGTGHLPHREQTQRVLESVAGFLTEPLEPAAEALVDKSCNGKSRTGSGKHIETDFS
jgi:pimeloyl-ACP methyl ester carboxylesterase